MAMQNRPGTGPVGALAPAGSAARAPARPRARPAPGRRPTAASAKRVRAPVTWSRSQTPPRSARAVSRCSSALSCAMRRRAPRCRPRGRRRPRPGSGLQTRRRVVRRAVCRSALRIARRQADQIGRGGEHRRQRRPALWPACRPSRPRQAASASALTSAVGHRLSTTGPHGRISSVQRGPGGHHAAFGSTSATRRPGPISPTLPGPSSSSSRPPCGLGDRGHQRKAEARARLVAAVLQAHEALDDPLAVGCPARPGRCR